MRIVYVEDNIANVHLVKRVARMGQHEIINYIDGMDALNNFETDEPDLVLMDIQLAGELTGIEVVKKLRDRGYNTPIFAVTAYAMVGDKERCMEAGCTGYMSKPIPVTDLVNLFKEYEKPKVAPPKPSDTTEATPEPSADKDTVAKSENTGEKAVQPESASSEKTVDNTPDTESIETSQPVTTAEATAKPVVDETATQEAPAQPVDTEATKDNDVTESSRDVLTKPKKMDDAEGEDKLVEETSVTSPQDTNNPPAKMT